MAKIKFGSVITDSRGAIGGHTLKAGPYGFVLGRTATPSHKQTYRASRSKALFAEYTKRWWQELDAAQRDDWRTLAAANPITNVWGEEYALNGMSFYAKTNSRLAQYNLATLDDAPADQAVVGLDTMSIAVTAPDALVITFSPTPVPTAYTMLISATGARNPGVQNFDRTLTRVATLAAGTATGADIGPDYNARLGPLYAGRQYAVSVALLKHANGALSVPLINTAIAT